LWSWEKGIRGGGKVGSLLLVFHFPIRLLPPELWNPSISTALVSDVFLGLVTDRHHSPFLLLSAC
jgi:hypothetical protein